MKKIVRNLVMIVVLATILMVGQNVVAQEVSYLDGRVFSDGVAWVFQGVVPISGEKIGAWKCIDKTGKTLFSLPDPDYPISDFSHGVALVCRGGV